MKENKLLNEWLKERDEVVKNYDVQRFKEFVKKWRKLGFYDDTPLPSDEVIEVSMRKMVCNINTMSKKEQKEAKEWLMSRGYSTGI